MQDDNPIYLNVFLFLTHMQVYYNDPRFQAQEH